MDKETIAVLGAGSWGTAMAIHLARAGNRVLLWGRDRQQILAMQQDRCNQHYLPDIPFPDSLEPSESLDYCQQQATDLVIAVPSSGFTDLLLSLKKPSKGLTWLTKGLEPASNQLLSDIVAKQFGKTFSVAILSGPSFAREVAINLPTAVTLASNDETYQNHMHALFHHHNLRVYRSHDIIGVQLCGAVKNVLAIACGVSDGLGYGANAKAALITRGLAEMRRLGLALKAKEETFMGLAGMGDLILTCTDNQSRNRRYGLLLGQGINLDTAEKQIGQVVEGRHNAAQVCNLANEVKIEMPICNQIHALLQGQLTAQQMVTNLMSREVGDE